MNINVYRIIFLLLVLILLTACGSPEFTDDFSGSTNQQTPLPMQSKIGNPGQVVLDKTIGLSFPLEGRLVELLVEEGDRVSVGDTIARIDTTFIEEEITRAEATLLVAEANYKRAQAGPHPLLIKQAEIQATAVAVARAFNTTQATEQVVDMEAAEVQLDYLKTQPLPEDVAVAKAEYDQAKINLDSIKKILNQAILTAPVNGTVVEVLVNEHEYTRTGQTILIISDFSQLIVEAYATDADIIGLSIGDSAVVKFDALPGEEVEGIVLSIKPNGDNSYRFDGYNLIVVLGVDSVNNQLFRGMNAEIFFTR